jgi:Zn-dependent protease with chaperone function
VAGATFFEHQQLARRNTRVMVVLFLLAVAAIVSAVDLVLGALYVWNVAEVRVPSGAPMPGLLQLLKLVPTGVYAGGALVTTAVIFIASLVNVAKLAGGGETVAAMAGARRLSSATQDPLERRLLNVVEEMAIASGVRIPGVYVMDGEQGINAFAAGWNVSAAVVAVTRGTLETLNRDELQGVIGHEFSHILNGDMRLNIRMLGVLAGIVFIGAIGDFLMRSARESRDKGSGPVLLAGLALFLIGYVGLFFARLIKAAVSREREFLADASSVQFTRNPDGLAGALDQIRIAGSGARISGRFAEDMSHMFFGESIGRRLGGLFDTHPPLDERIRRVRPGFQASTYRKRRPPLADTPQAGKPQGRRASDAAARWDRSPSESVSLVGTLDAGKIDFAARLLASLPPPLREDLRRPDGARAALIALLLAPEEQVARQQMQALEAVVAVPLAGLVRAAAVHTRRLGPAFHLPVVDLALPAIKSAPEAARQELIAGLEAVIQADRRVSLHEFVVLTLVRDQLAAKAKPAAGQKLSDLEAEAAILLTLIAVAGAPADATGSRRAQLQAARSAGAKEMGIAAPAPPPSALTLEAASGALQALKHLAPLQAALLVKGLFAAVTADGTIRIGEAELMRLTGAVLDCPLPPLIEDLDPAALIP